MRSAGKIPIHDLARPVLPLPIRGLNLAGRPLASRLLSLDPDQLLEAARQRTRLEDFGDASFRMPLQALLRALDGEAELSPVGRFLVRELVVGLLVSRLRLEELLRRHPEIAEEPIHAPVFIVGLPRTGTTHLHNLLSCDPSFRSLPYWESLEPIPPSLDRQPRDRPDPRVVRCARALKLVLWMMPLFPALHAMAPDAAHEEIQLLAMDFRSMLFEVSYRVPSYAAWFMSHDQTAGYAYLRRVLQALQWLRGPRRWLLKSPAHIEQLGPLLSVFPDARIVQTHRDPVHVVASLCTLVTYGRRMSSLRVDPVAEGHAWSCRLEGMLRASVRDQELVPLRQLVNLRFDELVTDEPACLERVYQLIGRPLDERARQRLSVFGESHRRGARGRIDYRLEPFELDAAELRQRLRFYQERFGVPDEGAEERSRAPVAMTKTA